MYNRGQILKLLEEGNSCLSGAGFDLGVHPIKQQKKLNALPSLMLSIYFVLSLISVHAIYHRVSCDPQLLVPDDIIITS